MFIRAGIIVRCLGADKHKVYPYAGQFKTKVYQELLELLLMNFSLDKLSPVGCWARYKRYKRLVGSYRCPQARSMLA